jgi:RNA polymerase sigma-70 factor (ECF subfamily)
MSQWPETSESLILRIRDPQDAHAWSQFMAIYQPVVYRLSRRRGLQHADAEDLCQQVFLSVARAVETWEVQKEGPRFRNWLGRVTRNAILNAMTRTKPDRATGTSSVQDLLLDIPDCGDMTTAILNESRMEAYRWAARQVQTEFSASTWTMFHETTIGGRSITDVAKTLGSSSGAVYVARCRVMQRIKDKVNEVSDFWSLEL